MHPWPDTVVVERPSERANLRPAASEIFRGRRLSHRKDESRLAVGRDCGEPRACALTYEWAAGKPTVLEVDHVGNADLAGRELAGADAGCGTQPRRPGRAARAASMRSQSHPRGRRPRVSTPASHQSSPPAGTEGSAAPLGGTAEVPATVPPLLPKSGRGGNPVGSGRSRRPRFCGCPSRARAGVKTIVAAAWIARLLAAQCDHAVRCDRVIARL